MIVIGMTLALDDVDAPSPIELSVVPGQSDGRDGGGSHERSSDSDPDVANEPEATEPPTDVHDESVSIDEADARRRALAVIGDGEVVRIDADGHDGRRLWEVLVRDVDDRVVEVTLDAADGLLREVDVETDGPGRSRTGDARIEEDVARQTALDAFGGGEVQRVIADRDDGGPEWEVLMLDPEGRLVEVDIDAHDGRLVDIDVAG